MRADEEPDYRVTVLDADSPVSTRHTGGPLLSDFLEPERRMVRIGSPQPVLLPGENLDRRRQTAIALPER